MVAVPRSSGAMTLSGRTETDTPLVKAVIVSRNCVPSTSVSTITSPTSGGLNVPALAVSVRISAGLQLVPPVTVMVVAPVFVPS